MINIFQRPCRITRTKGKAALGKLHDIDSLHKQTCCIDGCVRVSDFVLFVATVQCISKVDKSDNVFSEKILYFSLVTDMIYIFSL